MSTPSYRELMSVHSLAEHPALAAARDRLGHARVVAASRFVLDSARSAMRRGEVVAVGPAALAAAVIAWLAADRTRLRPVLNATGVLLHTGLGRAPLAPEAIIAIVRVAGGYCNLEIDLETGTRGRRAEAVADLLRELTGAEAAAVVNNNAAATLIVLKALAAGKEVIVSRGQLVEIGGNFRLPDVFAASGARLREVGTTNKTRLADYEGAIGPETAALLRVHPSNYRIVGFTESVEIDALAALGKARRLRTIDDIGSGAIAPGAPSGIGPEPSFRASLAAGADVVLASGDKLLGGPQCGLILGSKALIERIEGDPLMRALRVDKLTLAALEATLRLAIDSPSDQDRIPLWGFLAASAESLRDRAEALAEHARSALRLCAEAVATTATLGGGSASGAPLPSSAVRIRPPFPAGLIASEGDLARRLRQGEPAVLVRLEHQSAVIDLRAIRPEDDAMLRSALERAVAP